MKITPVERSGRVLLGVAAVIAGILLIAGAGSVVVAVVEVLLIAAGLDLVVTGALGALPAVCETRSPHHGIQRQLMITPHDHDSPAPHLKKLDLAGHEEATGHQGHAGHAGHGWMMIICCLSMLLIAVVLVTTGVLGVGFLIFALTCTAMMALMMRGMNHGGGSWPAFSTRQPNSTTMPSDLHPGRLERPRPRRRSP